MHVCFFSSIPFLILAVSYLLSKYSLPMMFYHQLQITSNLISIFFYFPNRLFLILVRNKHCISRSDTISVLTFPLLSSNLQVHILSFTLLFTLVVTKFLFAQTHAYFSSNATKFFVLLFSICIIHSITTTFDTDLIRQLL